MPERTPAFEAYIASLKNKKDAPAKGKAAKEGRLIVSPDELKDDADDQEVDAAV